MPSLALRARTLNSSIAMEVYDEHRAVAAFAQIWMIVFEACRSGEPSDAIGPCEGPVALLSHALVAPAFAG